MENQSAFDTQRVTGTLLALSCVVFLVGGLMFTARNGMAGKPAPNFAYFVVERSFVAAAAVVAAVGLWLLATLLGRAHGDVMIPAWLAAATYAIATILLVIGEASGLLKGRYPYAIMTRLQSGYYSDVFIVAYVLLAFLAQLAFGVIIVRTGFLPAWIGWAAIVWNIAWPAVLPIVSSRDIYFPVLHHVFPLLAGIALLRR